MNKFVCALLFSLLVITAQGTARTVPTYAAGGTCATSGTVVAGCSACDANLVCTPLAGYYVVQTDATTKKTAIACVDNCKTCSAAACSVCYGTDETGYTSATKGTTASGDGSCVCATGYIKDSTGTAACILPAGDCASGFNKNGGDSTASGYACIATATACATGWKAAGACNMTYTTAPSTYTNTCNSTSAHLDNLQSNVCAAAAACSTGYTEVAAGTASISGTMAAPCKYCLSATYVQSRTGILGYNRFKCVLKTSGACDTGYSDVAGAAPSATLTGAC
jgi:hypothetical protein